MKIKTNVLITLANSGLLFATEHDIPAADAYKASKFRREVEKQIKDLAEREKALYKDAGIDDPEAKEIEQEKVERFNRLRAEFLKDEVEIADIKPMSYESYHALAKENRKVAIQVPKTDSDGKQTTETVYADPYRACEDILEGILWKAPDEEEDEKKPE